MKVEGNMDVSQKIDFLSDYKNLSESQIIVEALEYGLNEMWKKYILSKYLKDEIEKEEAVKLVGLDKVKRAEREIKTVKEDVEWSLSK